MAALMLLSNVQTNEARSATAPGCDFLTTTTVPYERRAMLARGFNLPGWLDGQRTRRPDFDTLAELHRRGFTHVRLPVTPERLMPAFSSAADVARDLDELDAAIDRLIGIGFAVSLDLHPGARFERLHVTDPERAFELIDALWRKLSERYASRPADRLFFEVLNEPAVAPVIWRRQGPRLAQTIRHGAPGHTIIYGSANFQRIDALPDVQPLPLPNIVYAVHFYDPMVFTHQGLDWSDDPLRYLSGVPFPASLSDPTIRRLLRELRAAGRDPAANMLETQLREPWTKKRIAAEIARAGAWAKEHRQVVLLNEFGVLAWKAPSNDRLQWLETVRRAAEHACLGWAHWDYADAFGFVRRVGTSEIPDEAALKALLGASKP
jgi:endoglucanase